MIYRIDLKHFLTQAIDYFTLENLTETQYAIISAKIRNGGRDQNTAKINELYPPPEIVMMYDEYPDTNAMHDAYIDFLKEDSGNNLKTIYQVFINPLLNHQDVIIICDERENVFIDVLVEYLHKECGIDVIDLNELFSTGRTKEIYLDRDEIKDKAVQIRRESAKEYRNALASTSDGREKLVKLMSKKEKKWHLKKLGIRITEDEEKDIDKILLEAWNGDED